jgi:hypothetical protein
MTDTPSAAASDAGTDIKVPGDASTLEVGVEPAASSAPSGPIGVAGADTPALTPASEHAPASETHESAPPSLSVDTEVAPTLREAESSALSSQTDGLVLYDLTTHRTSSGTPQKAFSPHTLKTILDLKLLGIGYERKRMTFTQIRGELAERLGENVSLLCSQGPPVKAEAGWDSEISSSQSLVSLRCCRA